MMFKCNDCGREFDEYDADFYEEDPSEYGITGLPSGTEKYMCCPSCGSEDFDILEEEDEDYEQ